MRNLLPALPFSDPAFGGTFVLFKRVIMGTSVDSAGMGGQFCDPLSCPCR